MDFNLEDFSEDVLSKAMSGLGCSKKDLQEKTGLSGEDIEAALEGGNDEETLRPLAEALHLDPDSLVDLANKAWVPEKHQIPGLQCFVSNYQDIMDVNAYLIWDADTAEAIAFDTGTDASEMIQFIKEHNLKLSAILLTHTHPDHVADLEKLSRETGCDAVFTPGQEPLEGAEPFSQGKTFHAGRLTVDSFLTCGHSRGGTTYDVEGLDRSVAIVGDALFAGSMGGAKISYQDALQTNRKSIFSFAEDTVLCPGHGPMTTVAEEKAHNPFFPEFKKN